MTGEIEDNESEKPGNRRVHMANERTFYGFSILFLAISGTFAAKIGGSPISKSELKICLWGTITIAKFALTGYLFGVSID